MKSGGGVGPPFQIEFCVFRLTNQSLRLAPSRRPIDLVYKRLYFPGYGFVLLGITAVDSVSTPALESRSGINPVERHPVVTLSPAKYAGAPKGVTLLCHVEYLVSHEPYLIWKGIDSRFNKH